MAELQKKAKLSLILFPPLYRPSLHRPIVRMGFKMVFTARPTVEVQNLLGVFRLRQGVVSFAEVSAAWDASAGCYRGSENVGILAVVVPERKFIQVQRQVLPPNILIRPDDVVVKYLLIALFRHAKGSREPGW